MNFPFVSIIVPIRNEERYISRCLDAILAQDYPAEQIEILIADGMSTDNTRKVVEKYQAGTRRITMLDNPGLIVPTGMNLALARAKGEIVIRVDGHCEVATNYVSKCIDYLQDSEIAGVGGPMESIGETPLSRTIALAMSSQFGVGDSAFRTTTGKTMFVDTIPFPAYRRKTIDQVGLYDEELVRNQDDEYNYRIRQTGGKLLMAADIKSRYYSRGDFSKLWKQFFQYGFYKVRVLQKHPKQMRLRQFVPALFVLSILSTAVLSGLTSWGLYSLVLLLLTYSCVSVVISLALAKQKGILTFLSLMLSFLIIHVGYGCGFLSGLVHFWNRWRENSVATHLR